MRRAVRLVGLVVLVAIGLVVALQLYYFAMTGWYARVDPGETAYMRSHLALARERDPHARLDHRWVPYDRISEHLKRAVVTAEDARFAEHDGVDWDAVNKAHENNRKLDSSGAKKTRARVKGGSTITQQLAKNLFLSGERSYVRKAQELVIAYMLEFWMSKQRILEVYLNVVEWGNGVFGAEAAARHYYGIAAAQLDASQASRLAVMLPNPRFYDTHRDSAYLARRAGTIQRWLNDADVP